jgi:GNAT superfamily N-acetyltransferase
MSIRVADARDHDAVLELAARSWAPVFASVNGVLGLELAGRLHGEDWRTHHAVEVADIVAAESTSTWVADVDGAVAGFASARVVDPARQIGEVRIVGVDPSAQRTGVGTALTRHAEAWLRDQGMAVAFIGTGGDDGHAPARSMYHALGCRPFPVVQFYKALNEEERTMATGADSLDTVADAAIAIGDIQSAAIFLVPAGSTTLELAAASGIDGPALDGLVNAVRDPAHPVARARTDDGPTFDMPPMNPGGPRLRSHLPLALHHDGARWVMGVLAVAHDTPLDEDQRRRLIELADAAAELAGA